MGAEVSDYCNQTADAECHQELKHLHGRQVAIANLNAVLLESRGTLETLPGHVLAQLEEVQRMQSPRASASPQAEGEQTAICSTSPPHLIPLPAADA